MSRTGFFKKVYQGTQESQRLQDNIESALAPILRNPLLDGILLQANLVSGNNAIEHKLNRKIRGYIIVKKSANANIYDSSDDEQFLNLNSSAAVTVSLWVF